MLFGVVGIFMKRFGWSRPAFLIGFVLATQAESYLNMSVQFYGWEMFMRPGVLIILALTMISVYFSRRGSVDENAELMEAETKVNINIIPQLLFAAAVMIFVFIAVIDGWQQSFLGGIFPMVVGLTAIPFGLYLLYIFLSKQTNSSSVFDAEQAVAEGTFKATWYEPLLWIGGLYILSTLIGFVPAIIIFFVSFFTLKAKTGWLQTALLTAAGVILLMLFSSFLNLELPQGVFF